MGNGIHRPRLCGLPLFYTLSRRKITPFLQSWTRVEEGAGVSECNWKSVNPDQDSMFDRYPQEQEILETTGGTKTYLFNRLMIASLLVSLLSMPNARCKT